MSEQLVCAIPLGTTEEVRLIKKLHKGGTYLDMRVYFRTKAGTFHPSRKGIILAARYWEEIVSALHTLPAHRTGQEEMAT
jgi:hypothetical protein